MLSAYNKAMNHYAVPCVATAFGWLIVAVAHAQQPGPLKASLAKYQYDLKAEGRDFLLAEGKRATFFALGELHGENEIPELIRALWPSLWAAGYHHVAAELSPWAARRLEFVRSRLVSTGGHGLWRTAEAETVTALKKGSGSPSVLWGCDIEEVRPDEFISELALSNPRNRPLQTMVEKTAQGYRRSSAPELLALARQAAEQDKQREGAGARLRDLVQTLEVEVLRQPQHAIRSLDGARALDEGTLPGELPARRRQAKGLRAVRQEPPPPGLRQSRRFDAGQSHGGVRHRSREYKFSCCGVWRGREGADAQWCDRLG